MSQKRERGLEADGDAGRDPPRGAISSARYHVKFENKARSIVRRVIAQNRELTCSNLSSVGAVLEKSGISIQQNTFFGRKKERGKVLQIVKAVRKMRGKVNMGQAG